MRPEPDAEAVAERILNAALGTIDILAIYLGDRLGWYRSLARDGPASPSELAQRTDTSERYVREWLEQQAITGLLTVDGSHRFTLPQGSAEVLTDSNSLNYLAPLARIFAGAAIQLPALHRSYQTGTGVSWSAFGADARESQADMNRPWFELELADALGKVPSLTSRLQAEGARIADIGCGAGWSTIALARMFPMAQVRGFDIDAESIELARTNATNATSAGSAVSFEHVDAADLPSAHFDAIFAFECVHDMPYPVEVLAAARRALRQDGTVIVMDEAVAASFAAPGDELERLMYGFSLLICLPDGMAHPDSAGTGTVMRPDTLRRYALGAGFTDVRILPIEDFGFFRFYELVP
ncbi:class I SAM-dependent methyltransferase [Arthrobacter sedimenti]|uniref:class I SAM-dependent methyltransferase n=1 Tax=Arthrobacter sedimenti TaxID=2694931 RepID=UPI000B356380|nr:class I SAM-dependent methyltransferase [Arthrobacter sedimenti]OUM44969.1 SAM-dependent methyltransferase [Arthrobacter agilis]